MSIGQPLKGERVTGVPGPYQAAAQPGTAPDARAAGGRRASRRASLRSSRLLGAGELSVVPPLESVRQRWEYSGLEEGSTLRRVARGWRAVCGLSAGQAQLIGTTRRCTGLPAASAFG